MPSTAASVLSDHSTIEARLLDLLERSMSRAIV
jgi:hypothetical protein